MQSTKHSIRKFVLLILLSNVNCYLESDDVRLDSWTPAEQIKFYPRKSTNEKQMMRNEEENELRNSYSSNVSPIRADKKEYDNELENDANQESKVSSRVENRRSNRLYRLDKKEQDSAFSQSNRSSLSLDDNLESNQHLIWFLMAKIIPTTSKLDQLLCNANSSTEQLCTSFNHLHVLVGKNKRNSNDETFRRARLIEDLSNRFDQLARHTFSDSNSRPNSHLDTYSDEMFNNYKRYNDPTNHIKDYKIRRTNHGRNHDLNQNLKSNFHKKFDINHKLNVNSNQNFEQIYNHKRNSKKNRDFNVNQIYSYKKASSYNPFLDELINSKSIYKHHQRLKRSINRVVEQVANTTLNQHKLTKRSLDNEIKYPDIQQFGKHTCFIIHYY